MGFRAEPGADERARASIETYFKGSVSALLKLFKRPVISSVIGLAELRAYQDSYRGSMGAKVGYGTRRKGQGYMAPIFGD